MDPEPETIKPKTVVEKEQESLSNKNITNSQEDNSKPSSNVCHKCKKNVYPVEKLEILDKVWHKRCFACEVCGTVLTMKTYVALDKLPYCKVHYPKQTATTIAKTPEMIRVMENTKIQSKAIYENTRHEVDYHSESEATRVDSEDEKEKTRLEIEKAERSNLKAILEEKLSKGRNHSGSFKAVRPDFTYQRPAPSSFDGIDGIRYRSLYNYAPEVNTEIALKTDDYILNGIKVSDDWIHGINHRTGQSGLVAAIYLSQIN